MNAAEPSAHQHTIDFLGAAGTVTGSRFLISTSGRVLVDCGLFQGLRELRRQNWDPFPVDPGSVDAIVVSHAHLDHTGYLPVLVRGGFHGPIFLTEATSRLAAIVLHDSAHLLGEDAEHARGHGYSRHPQPAPLYTDEDVDRTVALFRSVPYDVPQAVEGEVSATFRRAGHILGSATIAVHIENPDRTLLFSGDLGRPSHPLLRPPEPPPAADVIVVECTYGNRHHDEHDGGDALAEVIRRTIHRGGSVVIPAFAVDRTEIILMLLKRFREAGAIPDVPIFVDSPMALAALSVYRGALADDPEIRPDLERDGDPFDPGDLRESRSLEQSKALNAPPWPCIIISASGMVSGGRVLHHLEALLPRSENTVVLVGYQAIGTRGRQLVDGARSVKIHGRYVAVRAEVVDLQGFSVHADGDEIVNWLAGVPEPPDVCYLVHGEPASAQALRRRIEQELGWLAVAPSAGERVRFS